MHTAFGRVRRKIAPLRTQSLLRNTYISKGHLFVVMRFIASLRKSCGSYLEVFSGCLCLSHSVICFSAVCLKFLQLCPRCSKFSLGRYVEITAVWNAIPRNSDVIKDCRIVPKPKTDTPGLKIGKISKDINASKN